MYLQHAHSSLQSTLAALIHSVEEKNDSLFLILVLQGNVIEGELISHRRYIEEARSGASPNAKDAHENKREQLEGQPETTPLTEVAMHHSTHSAISPQIVHLIKAKILQGETKINTPLLRVDINAVVGFSYGKIKRPIP